MAKARQGRLEMAQKDGPGPDYVECPKCGAFLTDNVRRAYYYVGSRSQWTCRNCGEKPFPKG